MKLTFVSNYLNLHQIPISNELYSVLGDQYTFIQIEEMEEERIKMGWGFDREQTPYLKLFSEEKEVCEELILQSDVVIYGGVDEEVFIKRRLDENRPVIRYSERLYKDGQWKFITPKGIIKKYKDHTKYNKNPICMLCAGAYTASDFSLVGAYRRKRLTWGYFPQLYHYEKNELISKKKQNSKMELLWTGRMLDWKHPEVPVMGARFLRDHGIDFHLTMIGEGPEKEKIQNLIHDLELMDMIELKGFLKPEKVRDQMEKTNIFLCTSDGHEGWGVVVNEAMNSGCAVLGNIMIGAVPSLVEHGKTGFIYRNGKQREFERFLLELVKDRERTEQMGLNGYQKIAGYWNPSHAAKMLLELADNLRNNKLIFQEEGPCSKAETIFPFQMYHKLGIKEK